MTLDQTCSKEIPLLMRHFNEYFQEDYAQQTGLISAPLSVNDGLKKEVCMI